MTEMSVLLQPTQVLKAVLHGDSTLFREHPELMNAIVRVYFHSSSKVYNRMECWGPLKDVAEVKISNILFYFEIIAPLHFKG